MSGQPELVATDAAKQKSSTDALTTVSTQMTFPSSASDAWRAMMFYEQIESRPPLYLRLLLPVPIGTKGDASTVGGESLCLYEGGHLIKRAKRVEAPFLYEFEVIEQKLRVGGTMKLSGGSYHLRETAGGTVVTVVTNYTSYKRPRWFWRPLEAFVCHVFHRFLLRAMRRRAEED
jgi:hypothetical protein